MALRALWVLAPSSSSEHWTIVFERRFQSVERQARQASGARYAAIPLDKNQLAEAITGQLGVLKSTDALFREGRDSCKHRSYVPAMKLKLGQLVLQPVVVVEHERHLLCGLPLIDADDARSAPDSVFLQPPVSTTFHLLLGMREFLTPLPDVETDIFVELHKYVAKVLPFGRVAETSASTVRQALLGRPITIPDVARLPSQRPYVDAKTKSVLRLTEMVRASIYNKDQIQDTLDVYGTIKWEGDAETGAVKLNVLARDIPVNFICVHPCVGDLDRDSKNAVKLRFVPVSNAVTLCRYSVNMAAKDFPLGGLLDVKCSRSSASFLVRLKLAEGMNAFGSLEVRVSFPRSFVVPITTKHRTCGEVGDANKQQQLIWIISQKFPSRNALLEGTVRFSRPISEAAARTFEANAYASVLFRVANRTFSGLDIEAKSVQPTSKKPTVACEREFGTSDFILWNVNGEPPAGFRELKNFDFRTMLPQEVAEC